ncbi:MAG: membrane protein insertion efficiency factor YidD [Phycisphaerales bacterium]|nr:membrane protein insertion efficiency factor YidD [Phycisphaerales bacterium]
MPFAISPRSIPLALIRTYQLTLGQLIGGRCRFYPSCSHYAMEAFQTHPTHRAAWLTARRLCRCHPLGGSGVDLVPGPAKDKRPGGGDKVAGE